MRPLIRSCIVCGISDPPELLLQNLLALDKSGLVPDIREEIVIWDKVRTFARQHQHVPELSTLQSELADDRDLPALDHLAQMARDPLKVRGDFVSFLERVLEAGRNARLMEALRQARAVATTGLEVDKKTIRGTDAAVQLLRDQLRAVERAPNGVKISGEVTSDTEEMRAEYQRAKTNPVVGNFCGLEQIDTTIGGSRNRELWIHAAYSSHMKSTFAMNWAYHLSVFFSSSVVFFSLEMNYDEVRRMIGAMHSFHFKFREVRQYLGLQPSENMDTGLDYALIRKGKLPPKEEEFYLKHVLPDLGDERCGYGKIHVEVANPNKPTYKVEDLEARAEAIYAQDPFVKIFVDHTLLVDPRERYQQERERVGEVANDLKKLARGFRGGVGTDITLLHQINRVGFAAALKKKEAGLTPRYEMLNLAASASTEQAADMITTSWIDDDLIKKGLLIMDTLKARGDAKPAPFYANVRWPCRRVLNCRVPLVEVTREHIVARDRRDRRTPQDDKIGASTWAGLNGEVR